MRAPPRFHQVAADHRRDRPQDAVALESPAEAVLEGLRALGEIEDREVGGRPGTQGADPRSVEAERPRRRQRRPQEHVRQRHPQRHEPGENERQTHHARARVGVQVTADRVGREPEPEELPCDVGAEPGCPVPDIEDDAAFPGLPRARANRVAVQEGVALPAGERMREDVAGAQRGEDLVDRGRRRSEMDHERHAEVVGGGASTAQRLGGVVSADVVRCPHLDADDHIRIRSRAGDGDRRIAVVQRLQLSTEPDARGPDRCDVDERPHPDGARVDRRRAERREEVATGTAGVDDRRGAA
ncbi:hypothetical protein GCM10025881_22190 [Pseudolysinimonas kribbensis]|uniref:Uncharacterized protein n=1 Tax=Pseudolysinimonas kribbensis TaxID=433641 RepID=A0ABQ6K8T4_9MICO|nr:hypothetical protein [Pseudolysinimonas kribbensis]GMA95395.1 hypothetical protein GCM10025881_22190 [Pseudolysinimonas kribbensis]